jgi:hypothetical protein
MALHGYTDNLLGQAKDEGVIELVITQDDNDQLPGHKALKRQRAQGTGKVAYHPAYWGDGKGGGSWDNDSQDWSLEGKEDDPRGLKMRQKHLPIIDRAPKAHQKTSGVTYKPAHRGGGPHGRSLHGVDGKVQATKTRQDEEATARGQA